MRILCVIDSLRSGGAQRQLVEIGKGFKEKGHEVSFLVYHPHDFYWEELEKAHIKITYIAESQYFKRLIKMRSFIRGHKFDVVLSFLEAANFICELAGLPYRKWKLVVGERSANPAIYKSKKLRFYRYFHLLADEVVSNSKANLKIVSSVNPFLSEKKIRVIYNLLNLDYWRPQIAKTKIAENKKFVIAVAASHAGVKNLMGLVESVHLLPDEYKKRLLIKWFGERIETPYLDSSFPEGMHKITTYNLEENFEFHRGIKDIRSVYYESDAVGLFSIYEGFPNTICEAMACGKIVICSRVSDIPLLLDNSEFLFDPTNYKEIKNVIVKAMNLDKDQKRNHEKRNRNMAVKLLDKKRILQQYEETITSSVNVDPI